MRLYGLEMRKPSWYLLDTGRVHRIKLSLITLKPGGKVSEDNCDSQ